MDVPIIEPLAATPPAPGSAAPGNLYADLQSRALWLGVDPSVDINGSVLISDIMAIQPAIDASLVAGKAYTNSKLLLYAPKASPVFTGNPTLSVSPATTDNDTSIATTAFVKAVIASDPEIQFLPGMIMAWGGALNQIGIGELAGWHLCDGASLLRNSYQTLFGKIGVIHGAVDATHFNLPNLKDRFILGTGTAPALKNAGTSVNTNTTGGHAHTINGVALTVAQIPSHLHSAGTLAGAGTGSGYTSVNGDHQHGICLDGYNIPSEGGWSLRSVGASGSRLSSVAGNHNHTVYVTSLNVDVSGNTGAAGSSTSHTHSMVSTGDHAHNILSANLREAIPYYTLAYIIKL